MPHAAARVAHTGAVTLIQCFGSALNLNIHFHMLFLDGVYVDQPNGTARFRWVKAPTSQELSQLAHTLARRVGRFLERQGLLERVAKNSYLASVAVDDEAMTPAKRGRGCVTDEPKNNGSNQDAALTSPRQGFVVLDVGKGAACGRRRVSFQRWWFPVSPIRGASHEGAGGIKF